MERNWTGILVEPNSDQFEQLLYKRRNVFAINSCLSPTKEMKKLPFIHTGYLGGLDANYTDKRAYKYRGMKKYVPCFPLMSILYALGNPRIDYLSLDVEGAELLILKTIEWNEVYIDVLTIEHNFHQPIIQELREFFNATGLYKEISTFKWDIIFKRIN